MLKPSDFNNAVPKFTNGNYANNPLDPTNIEEPGMEDYNRGVEPLETLPAQWWNWLCNQFTARFNKLNTYVLNLFNEITELLSLLNITPDGTESVITKGQLKNFFKELYPSYVKDHITITKSDVGLGNVPNVSTNNQTPTYTEASTLTALSSGEKLSVAFGKLAKAVSTLISHIANTNNPHSVTKAQVGLGSVVNTGDSATPVSGGTTKFTTGGAYTELAKKAVLTDLAPAFSTSTAYAIGDYVTYNGNLYRCTTAHTAGAWNNSHFTVVTVGDELEVKADKTSLAVPSDAVLHYSFDEVPDLPDGTATYKKDNDFTTTSDWHIPSDVTSTLVNNCIKLQSNGEKNIIFANNNIFTTNNLKGNIVIIKFTSSFEVTSVGFQVQTSPYPWYYLSKVKQSGNEYLYVGALPSDMQDGNIFIAFKTDTASADNYVIISQLYIGNGSYSTPVIDNSGNNWLADNNGAVAVQGVCGKGVCTQSNCLLVINNTSNQALPNERSISVWVNLPNTTWDTNVRLWRLNLAEYVNVQSPKTLSFRTQNINQNILSFNQDMTDYVGKWTHIVIVTSLTSSSGNKKVYINGVKFGDVSYNADFRGITDSTMWNLFSFSSTNSNSLKGAMYDDFMLFNRALSDDEVTALYLNKANTPKYYGEVPVTRKINGHTLEEDITMTKSDVGLSNVVNTGDSATPASGGTTKFTTGGAYDFFSGSTTSKSWLGKVFGHLLGREWKQTPTTAIQGYSFNNANYANGMWVASSEAHGLWWSTDGKTWTQTSTTAIQGYRFFDVNYGNGLWVASSDDHGLWWSTDGKTWTQGTNAQSYRFDNANYANGIWVASSSLHGLWWSTNGKAWTQTSTSAIQSRTFDKAIYANGIWVALTPANGLWWSTDGKAWTQTSTTAIQSIGLSNVNYGNGLWVVSTTANGLWWSTDGKTWTQGTNAQSYEFRNVCYGNGMWVASSASHGLWWSTNGKTWTQTSTADIQTTRFWEANYANGMWVASSYVHGIYYSDISDLQLTD